MGFFTRNKKEERQTILPNGSIAQSDPRIAEVFGQMFGGYSAAGVSVNIENALGVPAIWAAVNFLSGELAGLPLNVFRRSKDGRTRVSGDIATMLHDAPNDGMSSFEWRKYTFDQVFTGGRGFTYIERTAGGRPVNLFPLDPLTITVKRDGVNKVYIRKENNVNTTYQASEIIDIPYMLRPDGTNHRGPIMTNKDTVGLAIAVTNFGSKFFQNGGVPPFVVTANFSGPGVMERAGEDMADAVKKASKQERLALVLPNGMEIKSLGVDAEKALLIETQRFLVEQFARIYQLPPTFIQDLTNGTFSNTEQQDLHFVKHSLRRWVEQFEQELNLKLFGRRSNRMFAELNLDGLLRGDFKTRMEGYSTSIQNGIMTPNEARRKENLPDDPDGNNLMIQGATVPIANQLKLPLEEQEPANET